MKWGLYLYIYNLFDDIVGETHLTKKHEIFQNSSKNIEIVHDNEFF